MSDFAVSSENSSAPLSSPRSSEIVPSRSDSLTIEATSSTVKVAEISDCGSIPRIFRNQFAALSIA